MNPGTVKWAQWHKTQSRELSDCSSKCAYDCAQLSVHNTAQNSSDNLPSYPQTIVIALMLSIGVEGGSTRQNWIKTSGVCSTMHKSSHMAKLHRRRRRNLPCGIKTGVKRDVFSVCLNSRLTAAKCLMSADKPVEMTGARVWDRHGKICLYAARRRKTHCSNQPLI